MSLTIEIELKMIAGMGALVQFEEREDENRKTMNIATHATGLSLL